MPNVGFPNIIVSAAVAVACGIAYFLYQSFQTDRHRQKNRNNSLTVEHVGDDVEQRRRREEANQQRNLCTICYENLGRFGVQAMLCGDTFHTACIRRWFSIDRGHSCPNCRRRLG